MWKAEDDEGADGGGLPTRSPFPRVVPEEHRGPLEVGELQSGQAWGPCPGPFTPPVGSGRTSLKAVPAVASWGAPCSGPGPGGAQPRQFPRGCRKNTGQPAGG